LIRPPTTDKTGGDEPLRVVDLEIHTHTLSDNEISNIGHFIMDTFVNRTPDTMMLYGDKANPYDVRLDVYLMKAQRSYSAFIQVFNKWALHQQLLTAGLSEDQAKPLLEGDNAIFGQANTFVFNADSVNLLKEKLSDVIDNIVSTTGIPGSAHIEKSAKQHP
jgi:hypothetical protein